MKIEELEDLYDELIKESNSHLEPDLPTKIYHYTTIEALFNGLLTKKGEDGKICLRATNAIYLNDPEDIKIGMEYLHKILGTGVSLSDFETLTKNCANTYVTSFSAKKDHLPMWHMYAEEEKYEYSCIVRSQLSDYELVMLFYNCISVNGKDKFKPLIEGFAVFNNIRSELLVDSDDRRFYEKSAFDRNYKQET